MNVAEYDDQDEAWLRLSEALLRVWSKRDDFRSIILEGYRDIVAKNLLRDNLVASLIIDLELAVHNLHDPSSFEVRLRLVRVILHVWYKVPPELQRLVLDAVRDLAILKGEDDQRAFSDADEILRGARTVAQAMKSASEQLEEISERPASAAIANGASG